MVKQSNAHPQPIVAVTSASFSKSKVLLDEMAGLGCQVVANVEGVVLEDDALCAFLAGSNAQIAVIGLERINDEILRACPQLRFIAKYGVGLDNLDMDALRCRGVGFGWSGGVNMRSVSELVLGFALGHVRNIAPSIQRMKQGVWKKDGGQLLSERKVGVIGLGYIGTDVARLLRFLGCEVFYTDIVDKSSVEVELGLTYLPFEAILADCDIITFHVPSTKLTRQMFGVKTIAKTKPSALIINTSRGDILDFEATWKAVVDGRLGGFATDVFPEEPFDGRAYVHELLYFTPHIGGNAAEAVLAMGRSAIFHVEKFIAENFTP